MHSDGPVGPHFSHPSRPAGGSFSHQSASVPRVPSGVDEIPRPGESPSRFVRRAALDKGEAVASLHRSSFVLAADTIVVADGRILGKPRDRAEARRMLSRLAGREHRVYTAICLLCRERGFRDSTRRSPGAVPPPHGGGDRRLRPHGECDDKGGGVRGAGGGMLLIDRVAGSFSNVVGLPLMTRVVEMLARARLIRVTRSGPSWYAFSGTGR